jgi:hypothetical protein
MLRNECVASLRGKLEVSVLAKVTFRVVCVLLKDHREKLPLSCVCAVHVLLLHEHEAFMEVVVSM